MYNHESIHQKLKSRSIFSCIGEILLVACIFWAILAFIFFARVQFIPKDIPKETTTEIELKTKAQTGDIIAVSFSRSMFGKTIKFWTASVWSHVGMLFRDERNNQLYVVEMFDYTKDGKSPNTHMTPIKQWLNHHSYRKKTWTRRMNQASITNSVFFQEWKKIDQKYRLNDNLLEWLTTSSSIDYSSGQVKKLFCSEMVALLLRNMNIITLKMAPIRFSPKELVYIGKTQNYFDPILLLSK